MGKRGAGEYMRNRGDTGGGRGGKKIGGETTGEPPRGSVSNGAERKEQRRLVHEARRIRGDDATEAT